MYELSTEIAIDAPADAVWDVLMDFEQYGGWNPFVRRISGDARLGERLEVTLAQPGTKPMTIKPEVTTLKAGRAFGWVGHLVVPGLFDGAHRFEVEPLEGGRVRFVQAERFRGILVPLARKMLESKTRAGFESMNEALKARVEAAARS